jgi:general secretion pathway protein L
MAQHVLGVDLGAHAVKAVLLESAYRSFAVLDHAIVAVPPMEGDVPAPLRDRQAAALRALLAERGWQVDVTIASVPGSGTASQVVTLPFTDARRIEQTIPFEVEGQTPFDLSEVAWDWQPLGSRGGKSELYVGVARKEELAGLLASLGEAGLDPRTVVPAAPAYAALFGSGVLAGEAAMEPGAPPSPEAMIDLGHERTSVCIVEGGVCEGARTFAFGGAQLARALVRELGISEAEGHALLAAEVSGDAPPPELAGIASDPRAADILRRAFLPLTRELRATLKAWQARVGPRPLRRVHLAGELARLAGLADLLVPEVEGPVEPLRLEGAAVARLPAEHAGALALALALAIRGHQGTRAPRLNLRRGEYAFTRDFQHVKGKVARLGAWAALVLALAVVSAGVKVLVLARQEAALDRALCEAEEKILGRCFDNFEQAEAVLRGRGPGSAAIPRSSAVEVLAELGAKAPAGVTFRFDRIEITREKLHLQGTTAAAEDVDRIVGALRGSPCFGDARSGGARRRGSDGKFEFSVDSAITCADGPSMAAAGRRL